MDNPPQKKAKSIHSFFSSFVNKKARGETTTIVDEHVEIAAGVPSIVSEVLIPTEVRNHATSIPIIDQSSASTSTPSVRIPFSFEARVSFDEKELERDPGLRKPILEQKSYNQDEARRAYLKWKPFQPVMNYPFSKDSSGQLRRFNKRWFKKFKWLEYSPHNDRAYCHPCFIFEHQTPQQGVFTTDGYNNWKKVNSGETCAFLKHVGGQNSIHRQAVLHGEALMNTPRHIDKVIQNSSSEEIKKNHLRIKTSIDAIRWLTKQGCALRGHDESSASDNRGNFIELLTLMGSLDTDINDVILENAPGNAKYIASSIQKDVLHIMANQVRRKICTQIGKSKFCFLVDEAKDIANKEQMAIVLRFVDDNGLLQERFFELVYVKDTCAATLKKEISDVLTRFDLDIINLRGQGYDGASNMSGVAKGLQALLKNDCPSAYYVHCFAHRLQLALVATAEKYTCVWEFFSKLTCIVNLISPFPKWNTKLHDSKRS